MFSKNAYSCQTKLIGLNLLIREHGIGYSNLTPDPQGAWGAPGVKIQVLPNQKTSLTKVIRHDKGILKISSASPEELGKVTIISQQQLIVLKMARLSISYKETLPYEGKIFVPAALFLIESSAQSKKKEF